MRSYLLFVVKRLIQLLAVIYAGCSIAFVVSHLSPISPVETIIGRVAGQSAFSPEAINGLRATLTELFGLNVPLHEQYFSFLRRLAVLDFGPALIAFPTPAMHLIGLALPWTIGLMVVQVLITWVLGNVAGALAGYFQNSRLLKAFGIAAIAIQPIPYYIVAFMMVIVFGFIWPVLPISGGFAMNVRQGWSVEFALSVVQYAILPVSALVIVGIGTWFLGMRALASNIVTEDYVTYAELAGVKRDRVVFGYVLRNALVPQLTALAMTLGGIFSGTVITEQVFGYPGLGSLLVSAVNGGNSSVVLAISCISVIAVAAAIFIIDIVHPLIDPRVRAE